MSFCLCHIYTRKELLFFMCDIYIEISLETLYVAKSEKTRIYLFFVWLFDYLLCVELSTDDGDALWLIFRMWLIWPDITYFQQTSK